MIEMLGVLAIIGVLSAGGVWGYNMAMEQYKVNKTIDEVQTIVAQSINLIRDKKMGGFVYVYGLQHLGIIPKDRTIGNNFKFPIGMALIALYDWNGGSDSRIEFWFYDISVSACTKMILFDWYSYYKGSHTGFYNEDGISYDVSSIGVFYQKPTKEEAMLMCEGTKKLRLNIILTKRK